MPTELREAIAAIGVNVLVVDPAHGRPGNWSEMLTVFRQDLPRRCPPRLISRCRSIVEDEPLMRIAKVIGTVTLNRSPSRVSAGRT